jgi:hypothetical protein
MHAVALLVWFNPGSDMKVPYLGATLFCQRDVVKIKGVLGVHLASNIAVAAVDASSLFNALVVNMRH